MKKLHWPTRKIAIILLLCISAFSTARAGISITYRTDSAMLKFAAAKLDRSIQQLGQTATLYDLAKPPSKIDVLVITGKSETTHLKGLTENAAIPSTIKDEGFQIKKLLKGDEVTLCILARDEKGAMYGILDLAEQIQINNGIKDVKEKLSNPRFPFRAIKFNLPWDSYRTNEALSLHIETCRDLKFWQRFLDMMAENNFNVLSLWNRIPFTYMIRPKNFPKACSLSDEELEEWQDFWRQLFKMAKQRGIETYIVNWNIVVPHEFAKAYGAKYENDTSPIVRQYTRECITQLINEYDDLTGIGITLADWMEGMTPEQRGDWTLETFIEGIKQAKRPCKFIYRSVRTGSPTQMRRVIDQADLPDPVWVEIKFNWSHGHSTPTLAMTHDYESGQIDERFWEPKAENFKITWMIRNEDFFLLRWAQPDFIRQHISLNGHDYVGGYFIGSETYIPAKDYFHKQNAHVNWQYAFEKQWLYYMLWGRLLYDPSTSDDVFAAAFNHRYGAGIGDKMLKAYTLASNMPLRLASFYAATWDFTLYSEGFLASAQSRGLFDNVSEFISIDELIAHETLDPTYLSIPDYVKSVTNNEAIKDSVLTPPELADALEKDAKAALLLIGPISIKDKPTLECEIADIKAWSFLSLYFADKLRAATALQTYRQTKKTDQKQKALTLLKNAVTHWDNLIAVTKPHYKQAHSVHLGQKKFSWETFREEVLRDIQIVQQQ
ncbi:MAG: hypothetical protein FVQ80_14725 [Planctomycetes bacterium]|nr:hypothetical protein [Planctomycetota bacterium]